MIETTLSGIVAAFPVLGDLNKVKLPAKTAYTVHKLLTLTVKDAEHFENQRVALIRELGVEKDSEISVPAERMTEFSAKIQEILAVEVKVDWTPLKLSELDSAQLEGREISALGSFLVYE